MMIVIMKEAVVLKAVFLMVEVMVTTDAVEAADIDNKAVGCGNNEQ